MTPTGRDRELAQMGMRVCQCILEGISSASGRVHASLKQKFEASGSQFWAIVTRSQLSIEAAQVAEVWAVLSEDKNVRTTFMKGSTISSNVWLSNKARATNISLHLHKRCNLTKQLEALTHLRFSNLALPEVACVTPLPSATMSDILFEVIEMRQLGWNGCARTPGLVDDDIYNAQFRGALLDNRNDLPSATMMAARCLWYLELARIHGDAAQSTLRAKLDWDDV